MQHNQGLVVPLLSESRSSSCRAATVVYPGFYLACRYGEGAQVPCPPWSALQQLRELRLHVHKLDMLQVGGTAAFER